MIQMIGNNYCNKEQQDKINNLSNLDEMGLFIDETFYNILIREIDKRLTPLEELSEEKQNLYNDDDVTIRDNLKELFLTNFEEDDELSSFLYHLLHKVKLSESVFYLFRIIPRIHSELSLLTCLKYSHLPNGNPFGNEPFDKRFFIKCYSKVTNESPFKEFTSPHYGYLVLDILEELTDKLIEKCGYIFEIKYELFEYLSYCYFKGDFNIDKYIHFIDRSIDYSEENGFCWVVGTYSTVIGDLNLLEKGMDLAIDTLNHIYVLYPDSIIRSEYIRGKSKQWYGIHREMLRTLNYTIPSLGIINNQHEKIESIFRKIEKINCIPEKEKIRLLKKIENGRKKQKRLLEGKTKKYKNPYERWVIKWFEKKYSNLTPPIKRIFWCRNTDRYRGYELGDVGKSEDDIREEFGLPRKGEQWNSETSVYYMVNKLFEDKEVIVTHHFRPNFLDGLELDIYFEYNEKKVGIEYQGKQHFEPIEYFGGEESFKGVVERDKRKKDLCKKNGVQLIYYNYYEEISESVLREKLSGIIDK